MEESRLVLSLVVSPSPLPPDGSSPSYRLRALYAVAVAVAPDFAKRHRESGQTGPYSTYSATLLLHTFTVPPSLLYSIAAGDHVLSRFPSYQVSTLRPLPALLLSLSLNAQRYRSTSLAAQPQDSCSPPTPPTKQYGRMMRQT